MDRYFLATSIAAAVLLLGGCQRAAEPPAPVLILSDVPFIDASVLEQRLAETDGRVLVEFCVPFGCARCDQMREEVNRLAWEHEMDADFYRVHLGSDRAFAVKHGVSVCPSYLVFQGGEPVFRSAFPTTREMLASAVQGPIGIPGN